MKNQGFTLVETLVAILILAATMYLISNLISGMRLNSSSMRTLTASQAAQDALERTTRAFQAGTYGVLASGEAPMDLPGYTWSVNVCQASPTSNTCVDSVTLNKTSYSYVAPASVNLLRVKATYTPVAGTTGSSVSATLEIARP